MIFYYILAGYQHMVKSIIPGVCVFIVFQVALLILGKRNKRDYLVLSKQLVIELLLAVYACTILSITGIMDDNLSFSFSPKNLLGLFYIPFEGASIKMVVLNFLLFVPYGVLFFFEFRKSDMNCWKALFVGLFSSFAIEFLQAFKGRNCEIDDIIVNTAGFEVGFFFFDSIGLIIKKDSRIRGIKRLFCMITFLSVLFVLIFQVSNGDKKQAEENAYYNDLANPEGTLEDKIKDISSIAVYSGGKKKEAIHDAHSYWDEWYEYMGTSISNNAGSYVITETNVNINDIINNDKLYIEVIYQKPQTFCFYNNTEWNMQDVEYMLYCINDGGFWYGSDSNSIMYYSYYSNDEHPFIKDAGMSDEIINWYKESQMIEE